MWRLAPQGWLVALIAWAALTLPGVLAAAEPPKLMAIYPVADVRAGQEATGKTVILGTEPVEFQVKILGVLKSVAPGRDLILARLSGANLEHTGVVAGMSGSPVYIDGKLLGAVAYAWGFAKEPIAGITPFEQMKSQAETPRQGSVARFEIQPDGTVPVAALDLSRDVFAALGSDLTAQPTIETEVAGRQGRMQPIAIPLSAGGFGPQSLAALGKHLSPLGMLPVAAGKAVSDNPAAGASPAPPAGGATAPAATPEKAAASVAPSAAGIVPGGVLSCGLVTGDMDLTGIGTVTHVEGNRVWGWGHPFMKSGRCEFLLRGGYIHLINPNLNISTKMGVPLDIAGLITADVGSCIAGELGGKPDMVPMLISVQEGGTPVRNYRCEVIRQESLLGPLVASVLNNSIEELGSLPNELTVDLRGEIRIAGMPPIKLEDSYSGPTVASSEGVARLLGQLALVTNGLARNPFGKVRIEGIECHAVLRPQRTSAAIESARLVSDRLEPGEDLVAIVTVRPHKEEPRDIELRLPLPRTLPAGQYQATICDAGQHLRARFAEAPYLLAARDVEGVAEAFRNQLTEKRRSIFLRVPLQDGGLSIEKLNLPQLPESARSVLASRRTSSKPTIREALVTKQNVEWTMDGSTTLRFSVSPDKRRDEGK